MSTTADNAIDAKALAIGILSVTATVLFVGFLLVSQQPAYAIGTSDRGGDYIMLTQQVSNSSEAVVVIDAAAKKLLIYAFDYNAKALEIVWRLDLDRLPKHRGGTVPRPAGRRSRR